jgi:hypothetical protein
MTMGRIRLLCASLVLASASHAAHATGYFSGTQQCRANPSVNCNGNGMGPSVHEDGIVVFAPVTCSGVYTPTAYCPLNFSKTPPDSAVSFGQLEVFFHDLSYWDDFSCRPYLTNWDGITTFGQKLYSCSEDGTGYNGCIYQGDDPTYQGNGTLSWTTPFSGSNWYPINLAVACNFQVTGSTTAQHRWRGMRYNIN